MSELMPCQLCNGKGFLNDDLFSCTTWAYWCQCEHCSCRSSVELSDIGDGESESDALIRSRLAWNEMQTFIARGKLLDVAPPTTRARL